MTKKIILTMLVYMGFTMVEFMLSTNQSIIAMNNNSKLNAVPLLTKKLLYKDEILYKDIRATVYHALPDQTDATPFITADNSFIDTAKVNELRWIAVSRDLLKLKTKKYNFNGKLRLGDTIWVSYDRSEVIEMAKKSKLNPDLIINKYNQIVGWWVVKDTMGDYHWKAQLTDSTMLAIANANLGEYKIKNGIVYKKNYQRNWIDFLQHPKTGMLQNWNKSLIITKKKVVGHDIIPING